jgi:cobalt/nickel transport system permease protein
MLRRIDLNAHTNRWRAKTGAVTLLCAGLMACALLLPPVTCAPLILATTWLAALAGARVPARDFAQAFLVPLGFLAAGALALCLSLDREAAGGLRLALAPEGARTALQTTCRATAALSVTLLHAFTTPLPRTLALLRRLRVPGALTDLMDIACRTIFLLDESRAAILRAQQNRLGYRDARRALRSAGLAAAALFLRTHARAGRLERGLQARGYDGGALPVLLPPSTATPRDYALALALPALIAALTAFTSCVNVT